MTPAEAIETMPRSVRVGPVDYSVAAVDEIPVKHALATVDLVRERIELLRDVPSAATAMSRLLHELLHAIWNDRQLGKRPNEEQAVLAFEAGLVALLRDNPELVTWVIRCL